MNKEANRILCNICRMTESDGCPGEEQCHHCQAMDALLNKLAPASPCQCEIYQSCDRCKEGK